MRPSLKAASLEIETPEGPCPDAPSGPVRKQKFKEHLDYRYRKSIH